MLQQVETLFQKCPTSRSWESTFPWHVIDMIKHCIWYADEGHQWHLFLFFLVSFRGKAKGCRVSNGTLEPRESFACGLESDLIHWSSLLPEHYHWCFGSRWFAHETDWSRWNCPEIVGCKHDIPAWVQGEAYHLEAEMKDWMGLYRREHLLSTSAPFSVLLTAKDGAVCEVFLFKCFWLR